jgi:hypothetical protein
VTNYISSYCSIKNGNISRNGEIIFEAINGVAFDDLLIKAYDTFAINYPKFYKMDNLAKLGLLASEMVLKDRALKNVYQAEEIGVILSNASSSLDTDIKYYESTKQIASPALFVYTLPNIVMGEICIRNGFKGENGFFVFEQFDTDFMTAYVDQVLEQDAKACVAGWVEVLGGQHNVFLYLVENSKQGLVLPHTAKQLEQLYR